MVGLVLYNMDTDYTDKITKRCSKIMYEYPTLFPISEQLHKYTGDRKEFYVSYSLESIIGLRYICKVKCEAMMEFWWCIKPEKLENLQNIVIISVLQEYHNPYRGSKLTWDKMLKQEKL